MYATTELPNADHWREQAQQCRRDVIDSQERSDTDGCLSQWASGQMERRYLALARLADNGYRMDMVALFLHGEIASTHQGEGQWGPYWVLNDAAAEAFGKRFFTPSRAKDAIERDRARGFTYGTITVDARIDDRSMQYGPDIDALREGRFDIRSTDGALGEW